MRSFLGIPFAPYLLAINSQPIKMAGIPGNIIPLTIDWTAYGVGSAKPNFMVAAVLQSRSVQPVLAKLASCYIDNMNSNVPVYVYFPDTGYTLVAQPNDASWFPVFTNALTVFIIGEGFVTGRIPVTKVILCDIPIPPASNSELPSAIALWRASPQITRGNSIFNTNLGIPALGDQSIQRAIPLTTANSAGVFDTPKTGFVYLTHVFVTMNVFGSTPDLGLGELRLESTGISGVLFSWPYRAPAYASGATVTTLPNFYSLQGGNLKLDATETWQVRNIPDAVNPVKGFNATAQVILNYTDNPT